MKQKLKLFLLTLLSTGALLVIQTNLATAATLNVVTGEDAIDDNGLCQLSEAIDNINDQAQTHDDCAAGDGNNDTINLPSGVIELTTSLELIGRSVTIQGQGMAESIIDGDNGQYGSINIGDAGGVPRFQARRFTVRDQMSAGLIVNQVANVEVSEVEIDGTNGLPDSGNGGTFGGIYIATPLDNGVDFEISLDKVHVHDFEADVQGIDVLFGIVISTGGNNTVEANITNTTVNNLHATGADDAALGIWYNNAFNGNTPTQTTGTLNNITINNIISDSAVASGLSTVSLADNAEANFSLDVQNITVTELSGFSSDSAALILVASAVNPGDVSTANYRVSNALLSGGTQTKECSVYDIIGGAGTASMDIISVGGNLADDNSCSEYFNQTTDQNNVGNLSSTLGSLSDNGGFVPTIPLLADSPAVDTGVNVAGLTTDARGSVRPQGTAFDSGAYESAFTKQTTNISNPSAQLANTGSGILTLAATASGLILISAAILFVSTKYSYSRFN